MNDSVDEGRFRRFFSSCGLILLALFFVFQAAIERGISPTLALIAPTAYLLASSVLIAAIMGRLYAQHEIRKLKFDLLVIVLTTFLAALPFALSNILWNVYELQNVPALQENKTIFTCVISAIAIFLLFPLLFVTEALVAWTRWIWLKTKN